MGVWLTVAVLWVVLGSALAAFLARVASLGQGDRTTRSNRPDPVPVGAGTADHHAA